MVAIAALLVFAQASWERTLSDGTKLNLVAVSDDPQQISWAPDGSKLAKWIGRWGLPGTPKSPNPKNVLTITVVIGNRIGSDFPSVKMFEGTRKLAQSSSVGYQDHMTAPKSPYIATASRPFPSGKEAANIRVGCANDPWKTVGSYDVDSKKSSGRAFTPKITFHNKTAQKSIEVDIKVDASLLDGNTDYKIVAFASNGKELRSSGSVTQPHAAGPSEFWFTRFDHKVSRLELQVRKFEWFNFSDVRLIPNK